MIIKLSIVSVSINEKLNGEVILKHISIKILVNLAETEMII